MISQSKEDYLRMIYLLFEKQDEVRAIDIAKGMQVSKPSVSFMLKQLSANGLVNAPRYGKIMLTKMGEQLAEKLTSKHRLIELFLREKLHVDNDKIHQEAHRLEHAFSDETIKRLRKFLGNPKVDPHGKPIPEV